MTSKQGSQGKMPEVGPLGRNLIDNVQLLCKERRLSMRRLAAELDAIGRPIPALGLARVQRAERRVDVDELAALAAVLGVTPDALLAPPGAARNAQAADHPAVQAAGTLATRIGQLLAASGNGGEADAHSASVDRAFRRVQIEVEELLAEIRGQDGGRP
jgi:transcriptional regulator with XRE-family HTH domain